jgi:hypothetical protein
MAVGGFNGTDPAPTLEQFQSLVAAGRVHWFIAGGGFGAPGGFGANRGNATTTEGSRITAWVTSSFRSTNVAGVTLYDLTSRS